MVHLLSGTVVLASFSHLSDDKSEHTISDAIVMETWSCRRTVLARAGR
jgi:hypothetical protein